MMNDMNEVAVLIPSFCPDGRLPEMVRKIQAAGFDKILVVNDGSTKEYDSFFYDTQALGVTVIRHAVNLGKGRALKTGFNYILNEWKSCKGVITVDSDGQHKVEDMLKCVTVLGKNEDALVLGCRDFTKKDIPFRSRFGNRMTSCIMKLLAGVSLSDTQTGLRAFSVEQMKAYLTVNGERFEYETNMLLYSKEENIPFVEVPIETIYLENNKSSHFRPLQDSVKIYALFLRYLFVSLSSFIVDILLFSCGVFVFKELFPTSYIVVCTVGARVLSSIYNFMINRNRVFRSKEAVVTTAVKYYFLAVLQMLLSATAVWAVHRILPIYEAVIKIGVDSILFLISFQVQREWVFCRRRKK